MFRIADVNNTETSIIRVIIITHRCKDLGLIFVNHNFVVKSYRSIIHTINKNDHTSAGIAAFAILHTVFK